MDYDWFGPTPCGGKDNGEYDCGDFGYKADFWTNQTFKKLDGTKVFAANSKQVLAHFHDDLNMRFGGIRKPRSYSHTNLSAANGWLLSAKASVGAGGNNWNFTSQAMRDWYASGHAHFLEDGIDYWWNDEGETEWFTVSPPCMTHRRISCTCPHVPTPASVPPCDPGRPIAIAF